ncbi:MAG: MoxR family ATPase [Spirochaetales bacterium]|jgi:MoxR-like ATPase|nr:MoxR family ATPase [Spirochaetales bacterium]
MDTVKESAGETIRQAMNLLSRCRQEMGKRIIGQEGVINGLFMGLIAGGHVLLEGVPGLAKTLMVQTLAEVLDLDYKRIQFTPDLLPSDLIGSLVYRQETGAFEARKGPVFTNIVLADEINRAPAKVQSALLEAMQERQVTLGNETYPLPEPLFVLGTQNPIEQEGTYALPEAQLDRFLLKLKVSYLSNENELQVLRRMGVEKKIPVNTILTAEKLLELREAINLVRIEPGIQEYIVAIIAATRERDRLVHPYAKFIDFGASSRGSLGLHRCARASALFQGRDYVLPDDVKTVCPDVLRHRLVLSYEAESEGLDGDDVIAHILKVVPVP